MLKKIMPAFIILLSLGSISTYAGPSCSSIFKSSSDILLSLSQYHRPKTESELYIENYLSEVRSSELPVTSAVATYFSMHPLSEAQLNELELSLKQQISVYSDYLGFIENALDAPSWYSDQLQIQLVEKQKNLNTLLAFIEKWT